MISAAVSIVPRHGRAAEWLDSMLTESAPVGMPWSLFPSLMRIVTNARIFNPPASPRQAWETAIYWLNCRPVWVPQPSAGFPAVMTKLIAGTAPQGNLVPDAFLAGLVIDHGVTLCLADPKFARFPGLAWKNPLADAVSSCSGSMYMVLSGPEAASLCFAFAVSQVVRVSWCGEQAGGPDLLLSKSGPGSAICPFHLLLHRYLVT